MAYRRTYRRNYRSRRSYGTRRPTRTFRNRRLVTGHGTTKIEKLARYAGSVGSIARTVAGMAKMINSEEKYHDNLVNLAVDSTGNLNVHLTGIAAGDTDQTRNGNSLLGRYINIKGTILAGTISSVVRLMLICDKQADGVAPSISDVLDSTGLGVNAMLNKDYSGRFVLLKELRINVNINGANLVPYQMFVKTPWHLRYDGSTGNVADTKENQLYLLGISSAASGGTAPTVSFASRFNFYDN